MSLAIQRFGSTVLTSESYTVKASEENNHLNMSKSDFSSVNVYSSVHFLQGTRKKRPFLIGHPVVYIVLALPKEQPYPP